MAVMSLLLAAEDAGLGALFFGLFEHESVVAAAFGVPADWRPLGAVALGYPVPPEEQRRSRSAARSRPPLAQVVHRGRWGR
jgi:nitroreductase